MAVAVMLNNYFHDLAVAFLFAATLMARLMLRHWPGTPDAGLVRTLNLVTRGALAWVIVGGAVRAWFYREYEWAPRAGTAQIPALGVKHVVLFAVTAWGLWGLVQLNRRLAAASPGARA